MTSTAVSDLVKKSEAAYTRSRGQCVIVVRIGFLDYLIAGSFASMSVLHQDNQRGFQLIRDAFKKDLAGLDDLFRLTMPVNLNLRYYVDQITHRHAQSSVDRNLSRDWATAVEGFSSSLEGLKRSNTPYLFYQECMAMGQTYAIANGSNLQALLDSDWWNENIFNNTGLNINTPFDDLPSPMRDMIRDNLTPNPRRVRRRNGTRSVCTFDLLNATPTPPPPTTTTFTILQHPEDSLAWYNQYIRGRTQSFEPVALPSSSSNARCWALPDISFSSNANSAKCVVSTQPTKVTLSGQVATCSCSMYSAVMVDGASSCMHTKYVQQYEASLPTYNHNSGDVVAIRANWAIVAPKSSINWFYVKDAFVQKVNGRWKCCVGSHIGVCQHIIAVKKYVDEGEGGSLHMWVCVQHEIAQLQLLLTAGMEVVVVPDTTTTIEQDDIEVSSTYNGEEEEQEDMEESTLEEVEQVVQEAVLRFQRSSCPLVYPLNRNRVDVIQAIGLRDSKGHKDLQALSSDRPFALLPTPPAGNCNCGLPYSAGKHVLEFDRCKVYLQKPFCAAEYKLYSFRCASNNTDCTVLFDGIAHGLYCFTKDTFIGLGLLYDCLDWQVHSGCNVEAFVRKMATDYATYAIPPFASPPFVSPNTYRAALYDFIHNFQQTYLYCCDICKDKPSKLIGDATRITFPLDYYSGKSITAPHTSLPLVDKVPHDREKRSFCKVVTTQEYRKECMALLHKLGNHIIQSALLQRRRSSTAVGFTDADVARLKNLCFAYKIEALVDDVYTHYGVLQPQLKKQVGQFFKSLASDSTVLSYLPHKLVEQLQIVLQTEDKRITPAFFLQIQASTPYLAAIMDAVWCFPQGERYKLGTSLAGLLEELIDRVHLSINGGSGLECLPEDPNRTPSSLTSECLSTGICVGVNQIRERPRYMADDEDVEKKGECQHKYHKGCKKTGGIFTWFCEHGVCYGMYVLPKAEGRNEAFSFLLKYFKHAPAVVVYDFACSLHEYCLNREPSFFKDTLFVVDKFHWGNHEACARSYNVGIYDSLQRLNTEIAEQGNSALRTIKASASRMAQRSFMLVMRLFLNEWNKKKLEFVKKCQLLLQSLGNL